MKKNIVLLSSLFIINCGMENNETYHHKGQFIDISYYDDISSTENMTDEDTTDEETTDEAKDEEIVDESSDIILVDDPPIPPTCNKWYTWNGNECMPCRGEAVPECSIGNMTFSNIKDELMISSYPVMEGETTLYGGTTTCKEVKVFSINDLTEKMCPEGSHIMTKEEAKQLKEIIILKTKDCRNCLSGDFLGKDEYNNWKYRDMRPSTNVDTYSLHITANTGCANHGTVGGVKLGISLVDDSKNNLLLDDEEDGVYIAINNDTAKIGLGFTYKPTHGEVRCVMDKQ